MRSVLKRLGQWLATIVALPLALVAGFGRFRAAFQMGAHVVALAPGVPGSYLRIAYYAMTLRACSRHVHMTFGSFFTSPTASIGRNVSIGAYCVLGRVQIGDGTEIASGVHIPSGRHQHIRQADGRLAQGTFDEVRIGADCWIGENALILADVGDRATIGAGAIVVKSVAPGSVVVSAPSTVRDPKEPTL
jgi:virginiamycin A acetyltransferase